MFRDLLRVVRRLWLPATAALLIGMSAVVGLAQIATWIFKTLAG
jgi:hypothetical protein